MSHPRGLFPTRWAIASVAVFFTGIVLLSLVHNYRRIHEAVTEKALTEARSLFDLNLAYRRWCAGHGGVYAPVTDAFQPNPYLRDPRRDLVANDGTRLTLINPAMMTRQVHTILSANQERPIFNKVTSLKYLNPANAPDEWEARALRSFEEGRDEASEFTTIGEQPYLRLLKPHITAKGCLACHATQGYQLGDVRGGLSIGIPMKPYLEQEAVERRSIGWSHLLIWIIGMIGIGALATLVRSAERNYAGEKEFTETAINTMQGAFYVLDEQGRYVRYNKTLEEIWGAGAANLSGRVASAIIHPDDRAGLDKKMAEALQRRHAAAEVRFMPPDGGDTRYYYLTARRMDVDNRAYLVVSGTDITARRGMEGELRAAAVEWATTFDAIQECIFILDPAYRVLRCNAAAERLLGKPAEQILGRRCCEFLHGSQMPEECPVRLAFAAKKSESAVLELFGKTCTVAAYPVLDASGNFEKMVHTVTDISEQKKLETQLFQAQKLEAVGALAAGIAHDFNNVLSAILGHASLLEVKTPESDPRRQHVEGILASAERASNLTRTLLSFGRKQAAEFRPVELNAIVSGFQKILARLIGEDIAFSLAFHPGELVVDADKGQLEQVLMNLVTNARDAMPAGGRLQLGTDRVTLARDSGDIQSGEYAVISVSDTGLGMDTETREHLFEPFFTTKEVGKGTGLGLSIVYGIVRKHGGSIHVYSEKGLGATFKIFLPLSGAAAAAESRPAAPVALPVGSGTIFLVEDDAQTREVARMLLEECGYTVLSAADGEEAVRLFREHGDRIRLVLSDLILPKKSGREACDEMNRIRPGVKTIFMSGYPLELLLQKGLLEEGLPFIAKPLNPMEMLDRIRDVLGGG